MLNAHVTHVFRARFSPVGIRRLLVGVLLLSGKILTASEVGAAENATHFQTELFRETADVAWLVVHGCVAIAQRRARLRVCLCRCSHAGVGAAEKAEQFQPDLFWEMRK